MYKPPEYKPPSRKIWWKGPLTKNKPRGLLLEFYGIIITTTTINIINIIIIIINIITMIIITIIIIISIIN